MVSDDYKRVKMENLNKFKWVSIERSFTELKSVNKINKVLQNCVFTFIL